jgi:hypothetical protein
MKFKVSNVFGKGFNNHVKYGRPIKTIEEWFTESDYNLIVKTIEETFGYIIIPKKYYYKNILKGEDELRIYDKYGNRLTTYYGNNWGQYELDGILTFDEYYNRFVVFQFRHHFSVSDSAFHIIDGVSQLSRVSQLSDLRRILIDFDGKNLINKQNLNHHLNKLVVIYKDVHYSQLIEYFDRNDEYGKMIDLWKYTEVDEETSVIEKFPERISVRWMNEEMTEEEFLSQFEINNSVLYYYNIFKENLFYKFSDVVIDCGVNETYFDLFIRNISDELTKDSNDYLGGYFDLYFGKTPPNDIPTDKISYLKRFIVSYTDCLKTEYSKNLEIDYRNFLYFNMEVKTLGKNIDEETGLHLYDKSKDDNLIFNFKFEIDKITISIKLNNQIVKKDLEDLIINESVTFDNINNFISSFYENEIY